MVEEESHRTELIVYAKSLTRVCGLKMALTFVMALLIPGISR